MDLITAFLSLIIVNEFKISSSGSGKLDFFFPLMTWSDSSRKRKEKNRLNRCQTFRNYRVVSSFENCAVVWCGWTLKDQNVGERTENHGLTMQAHFDPSVDTFFFLKHRLFVSSFGVRSLALDKGFWKYKNPIRKVPKMSLILWHMSPLFGRSSFIDLAHVCLRP